MWPCTYIGVCLVYLNIYFMSHAITIIRLELNVTSANLYTYIYNVKHFDTNIHCIIINHELLVGYRTITETLHVLNLT